MKAGRLRVAAFGLLLVAALLGRSCQQRYDAQCIASLPGTHWNPDAWACTERGL